MDTNTPGGLRTTPHTVEKKDPRIRIPRPVHLVAMTVVLVLLSLGLVAGPQTASSQTSLECITDTDGANDEPGQKDLTMLCRVLGTVDPLEIQ